MKPRQDFSQVDNTSSALRLPHTAKNVKFLNVMTDDQADRQTDEQPERQTDKLFGQLRSKIRTTLQMANVNM